MKNFGPAPFEIGKQIEYINERHTPNKRLFLGPTFENLISFHFSSVALKV